MNRTLNSSHSGKRLVAISLGAGVQSSTLALMSAHGEFGELPDFAVFADTQQEPKEVYRWLDWLEGKLPFPVRRVTRGDLAVDAVRLRVSKTGTTYTKAVVPAFIVDPSGAVGLAMRQCTSYHKIEVIHREYSALRRKGPVEQWIGISLDESHRMKPAREGWLTNRWPLVERRMSRRDCLSWMDRMGYPEPPRSACVFCPYHSDHEWSRLKTNDPEAFDRAVSFEKEYQHALGQVSGMRGKPFLHRSLVPLSEVVFGGDDGQMNLNFGNECEGMCGV